eukprot:4984752-Lingulodinium_polyedra.AAC.1
MVHQQARRAAFFRWHGQPSPLMRLARHRPEAWAQGYKRLQKAIYPCGDPAIQHLRQARTGRPLAWEDVLVAWEGLQ